MPASRKAEYSDLMRIDTPFRRAKPYQSHRSLRILQRVRGPRVRSGPWIGRVLVHRQARHAVLEKHTRNSPGRQPVANLSAFEIDRENPVATARKHDHRRARVLALR